MQVRAYLNFDGRCEEALEFYRRTLGAEVEMMLRFKDSPEPCASGTMPPGSENKVMHCSFRIGGTTLMASDCHSSGKPAFQGISLAINPPDEAKAKQVFGALADGGNVQAPLTKTFFSPAFGVVCDRFGVTWMIHVEGPQNK
ncbi:MAG TPA: VOC family protein [Pirellulales bacterium]|nr:VOC family protein [Pirellulales bacterium]